ncbi:MAG: FkbM family methyltransferase [Bacteroidia bacterium]
MLKIAYYIILVINKLILKKYYYKPEAAYVFNRLRDFSIEGLSYKNIGNIKESGELQVMHHIKKLNNHHSKIVIFDIGANTGQYQSYLLKVFNEETTTIHSFEPSKETYQILNSNKKYNHVFNWQIGFGDKNEKKILFKDEPNSPLSSIYKKTEHDYYNIGEMKYTEEIEITTIDDFCQKNQIDYVHFSKIDIEGHELFALKGAMNMILDNKIEAIQFEFGPANIDSRTFFKDFYILLHEKYNIYRILKKGILPVNKYNELDEIFLPCNYLAILKTIDK